MQISKTAQGDWFIISEGVLWSLFPIITIISYFSMSAEASLAWSTLFAAIFFGAAVLVRGKVRELANRKVYPHIFFSAIFIGWLFYGFYFLGLRHTTAGNASIIALMELFFSYLLFNVWKKQVFSPSNTLGAILMLIGAVIILLPKQGWSFHSGDWWVLLASACSPFGNYYQQKLRKLVSSETILFLRSLLTFPFFFVLAYVLKSQAGLTDVGKSFWFLVLNGFIILGLSKIFWLEGIHRISVTRATAVACIGPLFTLFFAYLILHQTPTIWQLSAFIPLAAGLLLLTYDRSPLAQSTV